MRSKLRLFAKGLSTSHNSAVHVLTIVETEAASRLGLIQRQVCL